MTAALKVIQIGPAAGFQDLGRPGYIASGLTRGGAIDTLAVYEGAALLSPPTARFWKSPASAECSRRQHRCALP